MRPTLYRIPREGGGRMSTMAKPRGGDWLADEMAALAEEQVRTVVSLLSAPEVIDGELEDEAAAAERAGIAFVSLPIIDLGLPSVADLTALADDLRARLDNGEHLAIHCRFGIGRSSLTAAAVLRRDGVEPKEIWVRISTARGRPVPDTRKQREFIDQIEPAG